MNTLKFLTKTYESDPYLKAFFDNAAKNAQEKGTPVIMAFAQEATRLSSFVLAAAPASSPVAEPAIAPKRRGPKPGSKRTPKVETAPAASSDAAQVIKVGKTSVPTVATEAPARKKPGPKKGTPRKAAVAARAARVKGLPVIDEAEVSVPQV